MLVGIGPQHAAPVHRTIPLIALLAVTIASIASISALAQGMSPPVSVGSGNCAMYPRVSADGSTAGVVVWSECGPPRIQRVQADGSTSWTSGGLQVCAPGFEGDVPRIVPSTDGATIAVWHQYREGVPADVYCQRISSDGRRLWGDAGVAACGLSGSQVDPEAASDGQGGVYVVWRDEFAELRLQHVLVDGRLGFGFQGAAISNTQVPIYPLVVSDGRGGAIVAWPEPRGGVWSYYVQRVDADGNSLWSAGGVLVRSNPLYGLVMTPDGSGGAYVGWIEYDEMAARNAKVQHVDADGQCLIQASKLSIAPAHANQDELALCTSREGQVIAVWSEQRPGTTVDTLLIVACGLNQPGGQAWGPQLDLAWGFSYRGHPSIASIADGFLVCWEDERGPLGSHAIYAQYIASNLPVWAGGGVPMSVAGFISQKPSACNIGAGRALVSWMQAWPNAVPTIEARVVEANSATPVQLAIARQEWLPDRLIIEWSVAFGAPISAAILQGSADQVAWRDLAECTLEPNGRLTTQVSRAECSQVSAVRLELRSASGVVLSRSAPLELLLPPPVFALGNATPNPARGTVALRMELPRAARVDAAIYDAAGRRVRVLTAREWVAGTHGLAWDLRDERGVSVADGLYFMRVETGGHAWTKRVAVLH